MRRMVYTRVDIEYKAIHSLLASEYDIINGTNEYKEQYKMMKKISPKHKIQTLNLIS